MLQRLCVPLSVILVVFMSLILSDENAFSGTCPTPSPIKPRDLNCLNNTVYHIVRDPRSGRYIERCFILNRILQGYETILDTNTGYLNIEACHEGTFQRHSYKSNTQCACNETKGHCNETGQVVASNGSTTEDRTCRCDFRRGYKFSIKPSNECFCQSSSEDCTCIKEVCETGYRFSSDYECVPENLYSTTNYTCKDYISDDSITESVPGSDTSVSEESTTESVPDNDTSIPERVPTDKLSVIEIILIVLAVVIVVVVVCALTCCKKKCRPGRNGSATTNNEGKQNVPVQVTGNDVVIGMSERLS